MAEAIRFNEAAFFQARRMAARGAVSLSLVRDLGSGLENASEVLLANVSSQTAAEAFLASDANKSRLEAEGGLNLAARLSSQQLDQNVAANLASDSRGLSLSDQASLVAVGLKSLGGARGASLNFLA